MVCSTFPDTLQKILAGQKIDSNIRDDLSYLLRLLIDPESFHGFFHSHGLGRLEATAADVVLSADVDEQTRSYLSTQLGLAGPSSSKSSDWKKHTNLTWKNTDSSGNSLLKKNSKMIGSIISSELVQDGVRSLIYTDNVVLTCRLQIFYTFLSQHYK